MEITSDIQLKGAAWHQAVTSLSTIFKTRTNYMIYILSISIGIMYDKRIEKLDDNGEDPISVPRIVISNNDNGKFDFIFQSAILTTTTEDFDEDQRLQLAFGEKNTFNKWSFLTQFANFGVTKLIEKIGNSDIETMENISNFLTSSVEGSNFDLDELSDDYLLDE